MSSRSLQIQLQKVADDCANSHNDFVAVEEPLEIRLGYETPSGRTASSISVTMRTPGNDDELALGFLLSEGIIENLGSISSTKHCSPPAPDSGNRNVIRVDLASGVRPDLERLKRHFYTTSSCGVCGKSSLEALHASGARRAQDGSLTVTRSVLAGLPSSLRKQQATFDQTGGLHAAAAFDARGEIIVTREDVGRHNAVDKVVGALLLAGAVPAAQYGLIVSGRASFELMQKALMCGCPMLVAVSAPSSLAVQLAEEFNATLVGFLRGPTFNIYAGEERIRK